MEMKELIEKLCAMNGSAAGPPLALIGYDVDRIHDYVFATSKPMEIAGASLIVKGIDQMARDIVKDLPGESVCYANGGAGLVLVPFSKAESLCQGIEGGFKKASVTGSCTAVFVPLERPADGDNAWFEEAFRALSAKLRRRKDEKALESAGWQPIPGYLVRCESCGRYLASEQDDKYEGDEKRICPSCLAKRKACRDNVKMNVLERAHDLADLVRRDNGEEDDLAVIYCDARDMGSRLGNDWDRRQKLSKAVADAVESCLEVARKAAGDGHWLDLVAGGDDVLILVPARCALSAVLAIQKEFHSKLNGQLTPEARLDIGYLIADCHLPVRYLFDYAQSLMKSAKNYGYELADVCGRDKDAIDWLVIKGGSPLNRDIRTLRQECLTRDLGSSRVYRLTRKPYAWDEFCNNLLKVRKAMNDRGVSRSQLKSLGVHLLEHPEVARLNVAYQVARNRELKEVLEKDIKREDSDAWQDYFVSKEEDGDYHTGYFDLLELAELEGG
ncbi:MAG: hypothetical protein ABIL25_10375 [candidate division WOR-3 bacterium]